MISKDNIQDLYPLSPMQEGMLFHALEHPESSAYFEQVSYRVNGPFDPNLFEAAWNVLLERHAILRTAFLSERTKRPLQAVLKRRAFPVSLHKLEGGTEAERDARIAQHREEEMRRGFDLKNDALIRARILVLGPETHEVILSFHHILMDGWCMGILHNEFLAAYRALQAGETPQFDQPVPYSRYIQWLMRQDTGAAHAYWRERLDGFTEPSHLPGAHAAAGRLYTLRKSEGNLTAALSSQLRAKAAEWGVTVNALFQTAWALVLSRYAALDDVVFGAIVSGRPDAIAGVDRILGLFINLIPVRANLAAAQDARELARSLHAALIDALPYSYCPINDIAPRNLIDHLLVFENYPAGAQTASGALSTELTHRFEQTNYPFVIVIAPGESFHVAFHFNSAVFSPAYVEQIRNTFLHTLESLLANPAVRSFDALAAQPVPSAGPALAPPPAAAPDPGALAIDDGEVQWTYAELEARADAVAAALQSRFHVVSEDRVAVLIPRSRWLVLALTGIWKAGAAYVPIDPEYPPDRIRHMIEDAGCRVVLTASDVPYPIATLDLRSVQPGPRPAATPRHPEQLAYLIYTSGSTGTPKGVMISHAAAENLAGWHIEAFQVTAGARATLFASPSFDASLWEMIPYLRQGASLHPVPDAARTHPEALLRFLESRRITHSFLPTPVAEELGRACGPLIPANLTILTGGDTLRSTAGFGRNLINNYGPTESAVVATSIAIEPGAEKIPIGKPIANTEILILDAKGRPTPPGAPGEIHIASAGLARGYWNRPALTAEKFLPHPTQPGARIYRTGDTGYWQDDVIHFTGRNDRQVKVNGVRIELGEVEAALARCPGVFEAAATLGPNGQLSAWVAASESAGAEAIRAYAATLLPAALLPSRILLLAKLPRTRNGKVDYRALPTPAQQAEPPSTPTQIQLAGIWSEILGRPVASIHDNFFELGGHSLSVTRVVSRIREELRVDLSMRALFEAPTIAALESKLRTLGPSAAPAAPALTARPRTLRPAAPNAG